MRFGPWATQFVFIFWDESVDLGKRSQIDDVGLLLVWVLYQSQNESLWLIYPLYLTNRKGST